MSRSVPRPGPVYGIADADVLGRAPGRPSAPAAAAAMARTGIRWIQLRAKGVQDAELYRLAEACRRSLSGSGEGTGALLWIDDRPDVAALVGAAGVHLGQEDLPPSAARRVVGDRVWIGRSTHDREQLLEAHRDPEVDVIAVGPVFATSTKERPDPVVGLDHVAWARRTTDKPLVAIGGIDASILVSVLEAGADTVAVISGLCSPEGGGDVEANARRLMAAAAPARDEEEARA